MQASKKLKNHHTIARSEKAGRFFYTNKHSVKTGVKSIAGKIAIQGYEGSFHQEAARIFWGKKVDVAPCDTFRELIRQTEANGEVSGAMMAIENSIAGSILPNYSLLQKSNLVIIGEVYLHIKQQLMANPGVALSDIREVHSHPMALLQCMDFLETNPHWKLIETEDTALSARHIHQRHHKHAAAIASKLAAELYGLEIIAPNIHTLKNNFTRFLVLVKIENAVDIPDANKASVNFITDHSRGSLARVLTTIANEGINLSKLQSVPIPGSDFLYSFHADMEFEEAGHFYDFLKVMEEQTKGLRVFGVYKKGELKK
jgi:prephenate dehydratase